MPVPTDTLRNTRTLNLVFLASALVLFGSVTWLVLADHTRPWRTHQRESRVWDTAMTTDAAERAISAQQEQELRRLENQIATLEGALPHDEILRFQSELDAAQQEKNKLTLPTATIKGEIGPKTQQMERAILEYGADSPEVVRLRSELADLQERYDVNAARLVELDQQITSLTSRLGQAQAQLADAQKQIANLTRTRDTLREKLGQLDPKGLAALSEKIRNAPLLDWFNPSEKVQQVVTPDIRVDLNFLSVETVDRCVTCHVNIDKPAFEQSNLLMFVERQLASFEGQNVDSISHPAVMRAFWESAARLAGLEKALSELQTQAREAVNAVRASAGMPALASNQQLQAELDRIALRELGDDTISREQWYVPLRYYVEDVKRLLRKALGEEQWGQLEDHYRHALIAKFNGYRSKRHQPLLSANPVLLAHPKLNLFVEAESAHPMKTMGCTSCHEGSGQETDFTHAAHTPRDLWVDVETGAPVPEALLEPGKTTREEPRSRESATAWSQGSLAAPAQAAAASHEHAEASPSLAEVRYTHDDLNLADASDPAPFAPQREPEVSELAYLSPDDPEHPRRAVPQAEYWARQYHWAQVHYMDWEKPMHQVQYLESSCNKCHTEVFDLKNAAPRLFEGRLLFAQLGCVNCHSVEGLKDDLDIKRVGPSLVHVKDKLSPSMTASWVWSPKAFRPTTRMPHYFMLENNSSPVDVMRTRTEVAAMTYYLMNAEPSAEAAPYRPEPPPATPGNPANGRTLFNTLGCLACHTNLEEHGQKWIVEDLVARTGVSNDEAARVYQAMSYNQRHWYALQHLSPKLERTGPELSGVGTKLKAGRTEDQALAWLYDWLRNPRHYSSYTIMPSFRLSEQEANDLAAYLLTLERPGYEPVDFLALDGNGKRMLAELVAQLNAPQSTLAMAREQAAGMSTEEQLLFLGKKMIGHYGCNGCHLINGFEAAVSACTNLDDWGLKDPHKLDFGYFDHAFDSDREKPITVWKVAHEGLEADAPQTAASSPKLAPVTLRWERMELERRPWLYHKLHNTRVYDRGRTTFEGRLGSGGEFDVATADVGKPYDKLKMPKFFLTDEQVRALVTYVTSIRKPLVSPTMQLATADEAMKRVIRGRQIATLYNCYGCHKIEDNQPHIWEFLGVLNPDGSFNYEKLNDAPPRLLGQGAKTQPQWLFGFLQNVQMLRPWLKIRMPSFPMGLDDAAGLADYFAGTSQALHERLARCLDPIAKFKATNAADTQWFDRPAVAGACEQLERFALEFDLARPREFDPRESSVADRQATWERVHAAAEFLRRVNDVEYPFSELPSPAPDAERFARGQALFNELRCFQCHALGDEEKLLALWKLDNPTPTAAPVDEGDGYGDEGYGYDEEPAADQAANDEAEDEGYGEEEGGYGEEEAGYEEAAAAPAPTGPVYSAPNLSLTAWRLQRQWVDHWLQEPATIQPGTKMPQWFPGGQSAFTKFPEQAKQQAHAMYGYTGRDQRDLLMDFVYAAGVRNYTPGAERLIGGEPAKVELKPLPPPPDQAAPAVSGSPVAPQAESGPASSPPAAGQQPPAPGSPAAAAPAPEMAPPVEQPRVSSIQLHEEPTVAIEANGTGRVVGVVRFDGQPPRRKPIRMAADPYCDKLHRDAKVLDESLVVNADKSMQNVFVYVKSGLRGGPTAMPRPALLTQVGCQYVPHVIGLMAGQTLTIRNDDNTLHNVKMLSANNGSFNEGQPVKGMVIDKILTKPEMGIPVRCDVHPWMGAVIHVVNHPYFCVSDVQGRYEISGLSPDTYTLEALQEDPKLPPVTFEVTVLANTSHRRDVTLSTR